MLDYESLNRSFLDCGYTLPFDREPPIEWHKGRTKFGVWALELNDMPLQTELQKIRRRFDDYLLTNNREIEHITLFASGFLENNCTESDEVDRASVEQAVARLSSVDIDPISIQLDRLASFGSALMIPVDGDLGGIMTLRSALAGDDKENRTAPFVPHCTIGLYRSVFETPVLLERMRQQQFTSCRVVADTLSFLYYDPKVIQGPLQRLVSVNLRNRRERWF